MNKADIISNLSNLKFISTATFNKFGSMVKSITSFILSVYFIENK